MSSVVAAVGDQPDRDAPVLPGQVAGRVLVGRVVVAGGGLRGRRAARPRCPAASQDQRAGQLGARCRRRPASSSGGLALTVSWVDGPYRSSSLRPGGGLKTTVERDRPGRQLGDRPRGAQRLART